MAWEAEAAQSLDIPWRSVVYGSSAVASARPEIVAQAAEDPGFTSDNPASGGAAWLRWRRSYYRWLQVQAAEVDVVLLRHTLHDPLRPWALRGLGKPVLSVHHTLEVPELLVGGRRGAAAMERVAGRASLQRCAGVVAVTHEILSYERSRVRGHMAGWVYPNGTMIPPLDLPGEVPGGPVPNILFVADQFDPWHGLDRLLTSLAANSQRLVLHLVGSLSPADERVARADARVIVHGRMSPSEIAALAAKCSVGLTSFAFDRKDMTQACTLKVREYLQQGLPVYAGHDEVIPDTYPYLRSGPADIAAIAQLALDVAGVSRANVRDEAAPFIDKRTLLSQLYGSLTRDLS